jgi:hypothetical protein
MSTQTLGETPGRFLHRLALLGFVVLAATLPAYAQTTVSSPCWEMQPKGHRHDFAHRVDVEPGNISELKDKHRFAVVDSGLPTRAPNFRNQQSDRVILHQVQNELAKYAALTATEDADSTDFFVLVMNLPGTPTPNTGVWSDIMVFTRGQQRADGCYTRRIVWQGNQHQFAPSTAITLDPITIALNVTHRFIYDLKKVRGEK